MLTFHSVEIDRDLNREDLLYVGNFFSLKGMWWKKRKQRQALILSIAVVWYRLVKANPNSPGFVNEEILITSLTRQVKDAKVILERFFSITRIGFNFNDGNKSPTLITPRRLGKEILNDIEQVIYEVRFAPMPEPTAKKLVKSSVTVRSHRTYFIRNKLTEEGREDLLPACNWLLKQENPISFYYEPAGKLQARDKSVWPIKSIENWPGWLRTELFGTVIDIENAYIQYVVSKLQQKYKNEAHLMQLKYADLLRAHNDKQNFRNDICQNYLKLPLTAANMSLVKKILMSLANGSNATPGLMCGGSGRSEAVRIVLTANPNLLPSELVTVGNRLSAIAKQFKAAKKDLCIFLFNEKPTRENQKKIFRDYMQWERTSRYAIWGAVGNTGLHLHDGIDGIVSDLTSEELVRHIEQQTSLKVSVDMPCEELIAA